MRLRVVAVIGAVLMLILTACGGANTSLPSSQTQSSTTPTAPTTPSDASSRIAAETQVAFTIKANPAAGNTNCTYPCWLPTQVGAVVIPGESVTPRDKWPLQGDLLDVLCQKTTEKPQNDTQGNPSYVWYKIFVPAARVTDPIMQARAEKVPSRKGYAAYVNKAFVLVLTDKLAPDCKELVR